jgi:hypothetical protein
MICSLREAQARRAEALDQLFSALTRFTSIDIPAVPELKVG